MKAFVVVVCVLLVLCSGATPLPPLPEGEDCFTVATIGDTQDYADNGETVVNPSFEHRIDWLSSEENVKAQNILFVSHQGDIVNNPSKPAEWEFASRQMARLEGKVAYGICPGNHDMVGGGITAAFQKHFPESRFSKFAWYGGSYAGTNAVLRGKNRAFVYGNNSNSYQIFDWKGMKFAVFHLQCNAGHRVLEWVNGLLRGELCGRQAIVVTHQYLGRLSKRKDELLPRKLQCPSQWNLGRMYWAKEQVDDTLNPWQSWEFCYARNPNLFLILCGDQSEALSYHQSTKAADGHIVQECVTDYPHSPTSDWIRLYRFFPRRNKIEAITFSPTSGELCESAGYLTEARFHQFEMPWTPPRAGDGR